jgi:hypothetical protein
MAVRESPAAPVVPAGRLWLWLSIAAAVLAFAGSIVGLAVDRIYRDLTPDFLAQALAQDIVNLALVSPAMLVLALLALRGSLCSYLIWLGVVTFTVYNYVIYVFAIPFGPLFLLWIAVLGLSLYALIGGVATVDHAAVAVRFRTRRPVTVTAWSLIVIAGLFALLWLSEDVPALLSGKTPQSLIDQGVITNPVHILDLAFFLPAVVVAGVMLLRGKALGYVVGPALVVFLVLTGLPILVTPVVQSVRGEMAQWGVTVPIGVLTAALVGLLVWLLGSLASTASPPRDPA